MQRYESASLSLSLSRISSSSAIITYLIRHGRIRATTNAPQPSRSIRESNIHNLKIGQSTLWGNSIRLLLQRHGLATRRDLVHQIVGDTNVLGLHGRDLSHWTIKRTTNSAWIKSGGVAGGDAAIDTADRLRGLRTSGRGDGRERREDRREEGDSHDGGDELLADRSEDG